MMNTTPFSAGLRGLCVCGVVAYSPIVFADMVSDKTSTVVVSATRVEKPLRRSTDHIFVMTQERIRQLPVRNLGDILRYVPGVDVKVTDGFGQATSVSLNGSDARQVLIMVDGIPFNTQLSGQANPSRIPVEHIERVEVLKGAASSAWGSAMGGVINVITKDAGHTSGPTGSLTLSAAEFHTTKESLEMAGKTGPVGYFVSGSLMDTDGTLSDSDTHEKKFFSKLRHDIREGLWMQGTFGYSGADVRYGVTSNNRIYAQPYMTRYGSLSLDKETEDMRFNAAVKVNDQDITSDTYNGSTGALIFSTVSRNLYRGISLINSYDLDDDQLVLGTDLDWHTLKSNNYLSESKSINMQAGFASYTYHHEAWDVVPGIRYDRNSVFGDQTSPSLGVIYHVPDTQTALRAKVARAFNAPALLWIYNSDPVFLVGPNLDLEAETAMVYEVGVHTTWGRSEWDVNLFQSEIDDALVTVLDAGTGMYIKDNVDHIRRRGVEVVAAYDINEMWRVYSSGRFVAAENTTTGRRVRDAGLARQAYTFGVNYQHEGWGAFLSGYYNRWSSSPSSRPNDRKPVFDLKLTRRLPWEASGIEGVAFINIHNLTDAKYWSEQVYPLARRYVEGGVTINF